MRRDTTELKANVETFFLLLQNYPDDSESTLIFVRFLRSFLRTKLEVHEGPLPTIEVMTLIKEYKPAVFFTMRKLSKGDGLLAILTGLSMDFSRAEKRLQFICEKSIQPTTIHDLYTNEKDKP